MRNGVKRVLSAIFVAGTTLVSPAMAQDNRSLEWEGNISEAENHEADVQVEIFDNLKGGDRIALWYRQAEEGSYVSEPPNAEQIEYIYVCDDVQKSLDDFIQGLIEEDKNKALSENPVYGIQIFFPLRGSSGELYYNGKSFEGLSSAVQGHFAEFIASEMQKYTDYKCRYVQNINVTYESG